MVAAKTKQRVKALMKFFPNLVGLCGRLLTDRRVPKAEKALLVGAIIYALSPLDFLPDLIPFLGQVDDAFLIALTVLRLIERTDERIVREHWRGASDVVQLAESLSSIAPHILPRRISRVLSSKVEIAPQAKRRLQVKEEQPSVVEVPYE